MTSTILLCVDDDTTVLSALRTLLAKALGCEVRVEIAESGQEALEIYEELQQEGRELSVVISDFIMPGMRGDELLVRLHRQVPQSVKILLTGQCDMDGIKRAINEAQLYRFLEKPFDNADLVLAARTALLSYREDRERSRQIGEMERTNATLAKRLAACHCDPVDDNPPLDGAAAR